MKNTTPVANHDIAEPWWGLKPTVTRVLAHGWYRGQPAALSG
jgi:hypothetical protein